MKNAERRIFSLLLAVIMCFSMLSSLVGFAEATDDKLNLDGHVIKYGSMDELPKDAAGHVIKFSSDGANVTLEVGLINPPKGSIWAMGVLAYDTDVVKMKADNGTLTTNGSLMQQALTSMTYGDLAASGMGLENEKFIGGTTSILYNATSVYKHHSDSTTGYVANGIKIKTDVYSNIKDSQELFPTLEVETVNDSDYLTFDFGTGYTPLYTLDMGLVNPDVKPTADTFWMLAPTINEFNAPVYENEVEWTNSPYGSAINNAVGNEFLNQTTYMVGFPEATYNVDFVVSDGTNALEGAEVAIYEKGSTTVKTSDTTDENGAVSFSLPDGEYDYKVTKAGYSTVSSTSSFNAATVADAFKVVLTQQEKTYQVTWEFTDADGNALQGVAISVYKAARSSVAELSTDKYGKASTLLPNGSYTYTATLAGYVDVTDEAFTVESTAKTLSTVKMTESTEPVYDYEFKITDKNTGTALSGAKVIVYNEAGTRKLAEAVTNESGIASFSLEEGNYKYSVTNGIAYVGAAMAAFSVSSSAADNTTKEVELTPSPANENPHYKVTGAYDDASGKYKVVVTLNNIQAVGASFGLKYDSDIFTLITSDGLYKPAYNKDIIIAQPVDDTVVSDAAYDPTFAPQQNEEGYVTFGWYANNDDMVIDGTADEKPVIVTYYFNTIGDDWASWVDSQTFRVMDWTQTEQGAKDSPEVVEGIWSVEENKYMGLPAIPVDGGGYDDGDAEPVPIGMDFEYENQTRHRLTFTVIQKDTDPDKMITSAAIDIYDAMVPGTNLGPARAKDGEPGVYEIVVDSGAEYEYIVKAPDYWSNPESEAREDYNKTGVISEPTAIEVELRAKVYRDVIARVTNGTIISDDKDVTDSVTSDANPAVATWEKHATEGVNLYFVTSPVAGYELKGVPTYQIGSDAAAPSDAAFDSAANRYYVPGKYITDDVIITVEYEPGKFTVTANMNTGGSLTWNGATESVVPVSHEYEMGASSGELVFDADNAGGYEIYQVVINGSDYPFADKDVFKYTFNDIRDNHTISVIFKHKDAEHPAEYVVSVLAGEYGSINVVYDTTNETLDGEAAKDYIVPWDEKFTATATPDPSYEIDEVLKNGAAETIGDRTAAHSVELDSTAGVSQTVVATFRAEGTEDRIQYWIKTEIVGMGTIEPFGSRLYYSYEKPSYTFTPATLWKTESITFNGTEQGKLTGHIFETLTEDVVIVATFTEIVKPFSGMVNFAQGAVESDGNLPDGQTSPEVVFVRDSDGKEFKAEFGDVSTYAFLTGETDKNFTVALPDGTYTIKATKGGHLDYVITNFEVEIAETEKDDVTDPGEVEGKIVLTPGNTNKDTHITFMDILRVVNGMVRYGAGAADIDETGVIDVNDMNYAKANYAEAAVNVPYDNGDGQSHVDIAPGI